MPILDYDSNTSELFIECLGCGEFTAHDLTDWSPHFNEEFGCYENYAAQCPSCVECIEMVNVNIPIIDEMELLTMHYYADIPEVFARTALRNLIWHKRPDLADIDREQFTADYESEHAEELAAERLQLSNLNETLNKY